MRALRQREESYKADGAGAAEEVVVDVEAVEAVDAAVVTASL